MERRLPIYVLIDTSESMAGDPLHGVRDGLTALFQDMKSDPMSIELTWASVITFGGTAKQVLPLTEVLKAQAPRLRLSSGTSLGSALGLLGRCIQKEIRRNTPEVKGDYRPLAFVFTDGVPTDDWRKGLAELKRLANPDLIAVGCGPESDPGMLFELTSKVYAMRTLGPSEFKKLFAWVSQSTKAASLHASGGPGSAERSLPKPPEGVEAARPGEHAQASPSAFVSTRCGKTKSRFYLRLRNVDRNGIGDFVSVIPLADDDVEPDEAGGDGVSVGGWRGAPRCPHCGNPGMAACTCGKPFCVPVQEVFTGQCPWCGTHGAWGGPGGRAAGGRG